MSISTELRNKIKSASSKSYEEYSEEFSNLSTEKLLETAYIHGYNCAYNIYDVAEEKVEGMIKNGESPIKDVPVKSINLKEDARNYLDKNTNNLKNLNSSEIYNYGYEEGFKNAWETYINIEMNEELGA
ncbi:hypothetical protein HMPREF1982_02743 [Clostridiales bacterium oral taxon 876 str. F0540]|nr:hypothetical protein HMPREF1982_02743 [Clostridiales bacterium oral taxon 876 str. F0540]